MKLIMEGWRDFLGKARKKPKPEEEENEPSSLVKALMKRGGLTRKQAEATVKQQVELEEAAAILAEEEMSRRAALGRLGAGAAALAVGGGALASDASAQEIIKSKARKFLKEGEQTLAMYLRDNSADLANRIVPGIPFDADIIESLMKKTIAAAIRANAEEIAKCTMSFVTPDFLASLENLDDDMAQRYTEE